MPNRILVLGAGGFIGGRIVAALLARAAEVICAGPNPAILRRRFPACAIVEADLSRDTEEDWASRLAGVEAVVNAAGVLRGDLDTIHRRGPIALFDACARAGVPCVIQISALGAGNQPTRFLATKADADRHLIQLARDIGHRRWCVVRPSLVIGRGGASTSLFSALASLPWPIRLGPGTWRMQPIHVADLARAVADLVETSDLPPSLALVGPEPMTTDDLTVSLRSWLGLPARRFVPLPTPILRLAAAIGTMLPQASLTGESLAMLAYGNTGEGAPAATVLGWRPRRLADALAAEPAVAADLLAARMLPVRGVLLAGLVLVWIGSGLVSLLLPPDRSAALLSGLGLAGTAAIAVTWAGAVLDIGLGAALLIWRWRKPVLAAQLATMTLYTVLATATLPTLWLDPFGPLLKNAAVLACSLALLAAESRR